MSFVWQEASQPRQQISAQECLMSKSTQKKGGRWEETLRPAFFPCGRVQTASRGQAGASRGSQQLCWGSAAQRQAEGRAEEDAIHPLFIPLPGSLLLLWMSTPAPGCGQAPAPDRPLLTLPPSRHRTRHSSKHSPWSWRGRTDTGEPEGPGQRSPRGSVPSRSAPAPPGFV